MPSLIAVLCIFCVKGILGGVFKDNLVTVEFPDETRGLSNGCDFPSPLNVKIETINNPIFLVLKRKRDQASIYVPRDDDSGNLILVEEFVHDTKKVALYQGDGVEFQVFCDQQNHLVLNGTMELQDGKLYSLEPTEIPYKYILTEEALDDTDFTHDESGDLGVTEVKSVHRRVKRDITENIYIDVFAIIEHSVYQRWYERATEATAELNRLKTLENIRRHFAHIFNAVDVRYKSSSNFLNVDLVGLLIEEDKSRDWFESVRSAESDPTKIDANKLLESQYQFSKDTVIPAHDHLTSFTSVNLYTTGSGDGVAGLAKVGVICKEGAKSVSTCEYQNSFIKDVRILAHEIAHSLSARHDGYTGNTCDPNETFLMAPSLSIVASTNPFFFSSCSLDYFNNHITTLLESGNTFSRECLLTSLVPDSIPDVSGEYHGQLYNVTDQCKNAYGPDAIYCRAIDISHTNVCQLLYCHKTPDDNSCYKQYAATGTTCGDNYWCINGECVYSPTAPSANPKCLFGDQLTQIYSNGAMCSDYVTSAAGCSSDHVRSKCCASCKQYYPDYCTTVCTAPLIHDEITCECIDTPMCARVKQYNLCSTYWGKVCCI